MSFGLNGLFLVFFFFLLMLTASAAAVVLFKAIDSSTLLQPAFLL
jgi:hypothetical protein